MDADASALVERLKKRYASFRSYLDRGQVSSILPQDEGEPLISYQTFCTAFVRPDKFRFEFRDRFPEKQFGRYVVWREGSLIKTWWYQFNPKVKIEKDIGLGLAGATGVSHGVAVIIPQLLFPEETGARGLFDDAEIEILGKEECQDRECIKLRATGPAQHFVWIEAESDLIIRVEEQTQISYQTSGTCHHMFVGQGDLSSRTIVSFRPSLDVEIPPSLLEFGEPFDGYGEDLELLNF